MSDQRELECAEYGHRLVSDGPGRVICGRCGSAPKVPAHPKGVGMSEPREDAARRRVSVCAYCQRLLPTSFYGRRWLCDGCAEEHGLGDSFGPMADMLSENPYWPWHRLGVLSRAQRRLQGGRLWRAGNAISALRFLAWRAIR